VSLPPRKINFREDGVNEGHAFPRYTGCYYDKNNPGEGERGIRPVCGQGENIHVQHDPAAVKKKTPSALFILAVTACIGWFEENFHPGEPEVPDILLEHPDHLIVLES